MHPYYPARPIVDQSLEPIGALQYNSATSDWEIVDTAAENAWIHARTAPDLSALRVVSYNVLSSPILNAWTCEETRWQHILDNILPDANADVYLLNEVSAAFWRMALDRDWVRSGYYVSEYHFNNGPRNNMIISRLPLLNLSRETRNERRSYLAKLQLNRNVALWVVAAHLHAQYPGALIRRSQLDAIYQYLATTCDQKDAVLIMGDLNFHNERENVNILPPFYDVWRSLNPVPNGNDDTDPNNPWTEQQRGVTFDVPNNPMVNVMALAFCHRMRLDRALFRPATILQASSSSNNNNNSTNEATAEVINPTSMEIFAKDPVSPLTPDLLPSDHYALKLDFAIGTPK